jgi:nucleolysin TIA-1/TIAR
MAENAPAPTPSSLPSAPQPTTAQNQQYDAQGNGQTNPSHMPPPPRPPVVIPQNTNPIPTAISSPLSGNMMSPTSAGGYVRRAAPEPNKRALYVGGLDPRVTEDILKQIFETTGHVLSVKIIPDKNVSCALNTGTGTPTPLSLTWAPPPPPSRPPDLLPLWCFLPSALSDQRKLFCVF